MGRISYLMAREHEQHTTLYAYDLIWSIAKRFYDGLPMPSEIWESKHKIDRRSGKQIIADTLNGLGGE